MVPVPDRQRSTSEDGHAQVERFKPFDVSTNHSVYDYKPIFSATRLISDILPSQDIQRHLKNSCAFCPPLKAIPLASLYDLPRVPTVPTMPETLQNKTPAVELPRRESITTVAPQDNPSQNGVHNKLLEQVIRTPGREPSPQPTHLSVPGTSQQKVLQEEGTGYDAPKFEGKELQMEQGEPLFLILFSCYSMKSC